MKKIMILIGAIAAVIAAGIYYYITLPAINIHSVGFWGFIISILAVIFVWNLARANMTSIKRRLKGEESVDSKVDFSLTSKIWGYILFGFIAIYFIGTLLGSPIVNARRYQKLLTVEKGDFTTDVAEVDYNKIPLLDKESASLLGDRKMGSMVEFVSQFEAASDYTQINYQDKPVRVTPLEYASPIKWFTNMREGIPAYIRIDMTTQETECVMLSEGMKYSKSEYFNRNIYRHLRFNYPTYIFGDQIFFEIDEEGTPFWICPVKKFNIGLFGGETVGRVVVVNAISGECVDYKVEEVPTWIDKVYSAELLTRLYDYSGIYVNGYLNSVLSQRGCLQTTNGYNYLAMDDDVWVYTGVTSLNADQSNVGFVLMNQRTMETKYYEVEGAIEDSAMSSAQGQVQHLGYRSTFPLLLNVRSEPTYFMALKDQAGLVKKYAMVNVQKYQLVAIGDTIKECETNYYDLLITNGILDQLDIGVQVPSTEGESYLETIVGTVGRIYPVVVDGNSCLYMYIHTDDPSDKRAFTFKIDLTNPELTAALNIETGDSIAVQYVENGDFSSSRVLWIREVVAILQ